MPYPSSLGRSKTAFSRNFRIIPVTHAYCYASASEYEDNNNTLWHAGAYRLASAATPEAKLHAGAIAITGQEWVIAQPQPERFQYFENDTYMIAPAQDHITDAGETMMDTARYFLEMDEDTRPGAYAAVFQY